MAESLPAPTTSVDVRTELEQLRVGFTPKQNTVLATLPGWSGQFWSALKAAGISSATGHRWMQDPVFRRARQLVEQIALEELGITDGYVLGRTKDVIERCMKPRDFREGGALRGLELLGRHRKLWTEEGQVSKVPTGPGLVVLVQNADGSQVGVAAAAGAQGRVTVKLPKPPGAT